MSLNAIESLSRLVVMPLLLASVALASACDSSAADGGAETESESGSDSGGALIPDGSSVARLRSQVPIDTGEGAPGDLLVDIGNFEQRCEEPYYFPACGEPTYWRTSFTLDLNEHVPGVYSGEDVQAQQNNLSSSDSPCESNGPWEGGGTVEVISITDATVEVRLTGLGGPDASDGVYLIDRC